MHNRNHARFFAAGAHAAVGQLRKYSKEPYIIHCDNVVRILDTTIEPFNDVACAAYLHDVVEDTKITRAVIESTFGPKIATLVDEVTDVATLADGNRAARKAVERNHLAQACADSQNIKVADLIDNTRNIVAHDPKFARIYLAEKKLLLGVLTKADKRLMDIAMAQIEHNEKLVVLHGST